MTREEVISRLSDIRADYSCFEDDERPKYHALSMAIEALQEPTGDTISRQEVHKVLSILSTEGGNDAKMLFMDAHEMVDEIKSAEPTSDTSGWIPVSERLPEHTGDVLVTVGINRHGFGMYDEIRVATWNTVYRMFYIHESEAVICGEIIAWQPLPEPYREDGEDE